MMKIYWMKTDAFLDKDRFWQGCTLIDQTRLEKVRICKRTEDKVRSLCCGLLLQYAMKEQLGAADKKQPEVLELRYGWGRWGKPYLIDHPQLFFNLSHSGNYVVLALSHKEVGIDIQQKRPVKETMIKRVLAQQEYKRYRELSATMEAEKALSWFFSCWCAKESFCKLTGKGLGEELSSLLYLREAGRIIRLLDTGEAGEKERGADCKEYLLAEDCCMNVCSYEKGEFPSEVTEVTISHIIS